MHTYPLHILTHVHIPPHLNERSHSLFLFPQKHPEIFSESGLNILLEIHYEMGQSLERKDTLNQNHKTFL